MVRMRYEVLNLAVVLTLLAVTAPAREPATLADRDALAEFQTLVGSWRGTGQPRRGSSRDAWREQGAWAWEFRDASAALVFSAEDARIYKELRLVPASRDNADDATAAEPTGWRIEATRREGGVDRFRGARQGDSAWLFELEGDAAAPVTRITLRVVAEGDRLLVLLEKRGAAAAPYSRVAEIGYTRVGSTFGQGTTQRECIVTGGAGTIAVEYQGQTYYVCCGGCKDLFESDPEKVLAEYRERRAAQKKD